MNLPNDVYEYLTNFADNRTILNMLSVNKKFHDEKFFERIMRRKYPLLVSYKKSDETWKKFFLRTVHDISILDEKYGIPYEPIPDYDPSNLLQESVYEKHFGHRHYVDWLYEEALNIFAGAGNLDIVKLMIEKGARPIYGLVSAVKNNHIDIVKYLISHGVDEDDIEDALDVAYDKGVNEDEITTALESIDDPEIKDYLKTLFGR